MKIEVDKKELTVILHTLQEEKDRVQKAGGNCYGVLTLSGVDDLISNLKYQEKMQKVAS